MSSQRKNKNCVSFACFWVSSVMTAYPSGRYWNFLLFGHLLPSADERFCTQDICSSWVHGGHFLAKPQSRHTGPMCCQAGQQMLPTLNAVVCWVGCVGVSWSAVLPSHLLLISAFFLGFFLHWYFYAAPWVTSVVLRNECLSFYFPCKSLACPL